MKKILLFSGSNSSTSVNQQLVTYAATLAENAETKVIDLRDYEPPMFGTDLEKEVGTHQKIKDLVAEIEGADAVVVSTPEHNGMPPAFLKNILDWLSRVKMISGSETQYLEGKPTLIMSAGPGKGGALKARDLVKTILSYAGADFVGEFSLPSFYDNFQDGKLVNEELNTELKGLISKL